MLFVKALLICYIVIHGYIGMVSMFESLKPRLGFRFWREVDFVSLLAGAVLLLVASAWGTALFHPKFGIWYLG